MDVIDIGKAVATALVPPRDSASPDEIYRWRWSVGIILGGSIIMQVIHIAWACGYLAFIGLPGFAQAQEIGTITQAQVAMNNQMRDLKEDQRAIRAGQLDANIQTTRARQCRAITQKNEDAMSFAGVQLQSLLYQYQQLMRATYYRLPDCSEL